jgi:hypothetical protein
MRAQDFRRNTATSGVLPRRRPREVALQSASRMFAPIRHQSRFTPNGGILILVTGWQRSDRPVSGTGSGLVGSALVPEASLDWVHVAPALWTLRLRDQIARHSTLRAVHEKRPYGVRPENATSCATGSVELVVTTGPNGAAGSGPLISSAMACR